MVSFVYAFNDAIDRVPLWNYIFSISTSLPWCLLGDFNCVTSMDEIFGGREHWTPEMQAFKNCLIDSGLGAVRTVGGSFTWFDKHALAPIFKRLDRMVGNATWFRVFTEGNVFVKHQGLMDHNPILFKEPMQLRRYGKPF